MITKYTVRLVQPKGTDSHDLFTTNRHGEYFLKFLLNPYVYILSRNTSNAHKRLSLLSHLTFLPSPPPKKKIIQATARELQAISIKLGSFFFVCTRTSFFVCFSIFKSFSFVFHISPSVHNFFHVIRQTVKKRNTFWN